MAGPSPTGLQAWPVSSSDGWDCVCFLSSERQPSQESPVRGTLGTCWYQRMPLASSKRRIFMLGLNWAQKAPNISSRWTW